MVNNIGLNSVIGDVDILTSELLKSDILVVKSLTFEAQIQDSNSNNIDLSIVAPSKQHAIPYKNIYSLESGGYTPPAEPGATVSHLNDLKATARLVTVASFGCKYSVKQGEPKVTGIKEILSDLKGPNQIISDSRIHAMVINTFDYHRAAFANKSWYSPRSEKLLISPLLKKEEMIALLSKGDIGAAATLASLNDFNVDLDLFDRLGVYGEDVNSLYQSSNYNHIFLEATLEIALSDAQKGIGTGDVDISCLERFSGYDRLKNRKTAEASSPPSAGH